MGMGKGKENRKQFIMQAKFSRRTAKYFVQNWVLLDKEKQKNVFISMISNTTRFVLRLLKDRGRSNSWSGCFKHFIVKDIPVISFP